MKFSIDKVVSGGGRLGTIVHSGCHGSVTIETPMCTLFTRGGSAPHLGADMLKRISNVPDVATMNTGYFAPHHDNIAAFGKGLGEFTAMKNSIIFTTLHCASEAVFSGKNDKNGVAVWGKGGKFKLDPSLYIKVQETFRPDWFQALSDGDTDKDTGKKRLMKAVNNTLDFLDETVKLMAESDVLKSSCLIGAVEGGYDEMERVRSAKETAARPVHGFLIEGFEKGHSGLDLFGVENFSSILEKTVTILPEDKPRMMETVWSPLQVIQAFQLGIDVFSSVYPYMLSEKGQALVADYTLPAACLSGKLETGASGDAQTETAAKMFIDLNDKCFFEDFGPIQKKCPCYSCTTFTRSYIHHLLNTSELLAYVLLTIHNFHQFFDFFDHLRKSAREGTLQDLKTSLEHQSCNQSSQR